MSEAMSSFETVRKAIESLWEEELTAVKKAEAEAAKNISQARKEVARLEGRIAETGQRIAMLHGEQEQLPTLLAKADLEEDKQAEKAVRTRYSEITEELKELEEILAGARQEYEKLTKGDPERYLRGVEKANRVSHKRRELREKVEKEYRQLSQLLEDNRGIVILGYSEREREAEAQKARITQGIARDKAVHAAATRLLATEVVRNPNILDGPSGPNLRKQLEDGGYPVKDLAGRAKKADLAQQAAAREHLGTTEMYDGVSVDPTVDISQLVAQVEANPSLLENAEVSKQLAQAGYTRAELGSSFSRAGASKL